MKSKIFVFIYLMVTAFMCFYLMDPYLRGCVKDEGLKYAIILMLWIYSFCNPYIILGAINFQSRRTYENRSMYVVGAT